MKRYRILLSTTVYESKSGKRSDEVRIGAGFTHEVTVTEEFLRDAGIPFPLGQQLEAVVLKDIKQICGGDAE